MTVTVTVTRAAWRVCAASESGSEDHHDRMPPGPGPPTAWPVGVGARTVCQAESALSASDSDSSIRATCPDPGSDSDWLLGL